MGFAGFGVLEFWRGGGALVGGWGCAFEVPGVEGSLVSLLEYVKLANYNSRF